MLLRYLESSLSWLCFDRVCRTVCDRIVCTCNLIFPNPTAPEVTIMTSWPLSTNTHTCSTRDASLVSETPNSLSRVSTLVPTCSAPTRLQHHAHASIILPPRGAYAARNRH